MISFALMLMTLPSRIAEVRAGQADRARFATASSSSGEHGESSTGLASSNAQIQTDAVFWLLLEYLLHIADFALNFPAGFLYRPAIFHIGIARRSARFFFCSAFGFFECSFDFIFGARLHIS